jgi:hypothetical protein
MQREMMATAMAKKMVRLIAVPMMAAVGRTVGLLGVVLVVVWGEMVVIPDDDRGVWDADGEGDVIAGNEDDVVLRIGEVVINVEGVVTGNEELDVVIISRNDRISKEC